MTIELARYHFSKATHLLTKNEFPEAIKLFQKVLDILPNHLPSLINIAICYGHTHQHDIAEYHFQLAQSLAPQNPLPFMEHAKMLQATNQHLLAINVLKTAPFDDQKDFLLSMSFSKTNQPQLATDHLKIAYRKTNDTDVLNLLVQEAANACDWSSFRTHSQELIHITKSQISDGNKSSLTPLTALKISSDRSFCLQVARSYTASTRPSIFPQKTSSGKIRLAYLSSDLRHHPVGIHMKHVFRHHDKDRFHITILSNHPGDDSLEHLEATTHADTYIDISSSSVPKDLTFDVIIDLNGHTAGERFDILEKRLSPVQISYLGFPGSTGTSFHDYSITDKVLAPRGHQEEYSETLLHLDRCYQAQSYTPLTTKRTTKASHHLPKDAFVFASFNSSYKITRVVFDAWMKVLKHTKNSVLWLLDDNPDATQNLKTHAKNHIDPSRMIFAPRMPLDQHLERLHHADLCLDTFPYNGGSTTSNALFMNIPVVTISGTHYPSRMSTSMLTHLGQKNLITKDQDGYQKTAISLAASKSALKEAKVAIKHEARKTNFFSSKHFTQSLEKALISTIEK